MINREIILRGISIQISGDKSWEDVRRAESFGFGAMPSPLDELKNKLNKVSEKTSPFKK